jgi:G6PDH family F420-dependent oxidoreductase
MRIHPAIVAQAAATAACLMPSRFFLGVGTGENLNEHILGQAWPEWEIRAEMLAEAVGLMRSLWQGDVVSHRGPHFRVQNARIYTRPEEPPPVYVAASGRRMAALAATYGDGLIGTKADASLLDAWTGAGGHGPRFGQVTVCWASSEREARRTAHRWWPTAALKGEVTQELPDPSHFTDLVSVLTEDQVAAAIPCGPAVETHVQAIHAYRDAGFDHIYLHQVGPDQAGFLDFAERELLPALGRS